MNYSITFLNKPTNQSDLEFRKIGLVHLESVREDLTRLFCTADLTADQVVNDSDLPNELKKEINREITELHNDNADCTLVSELLCYDEILEYYQKRQCEYGLSFDYVELGQFPNMERDYFLYQLSWGGPSTEIRFYDDGQIEFVFLDWFCGVDFDCTEDTVFNCVKDFFQDVGSIDFIKEREKYDYCSELEKKIDKNN